MISPPARNLRKGREGEKENIERKEKKKLQNYNKKPRVMEELRRQTKQKGLLDGGNMADDGDGY